MEIIKTVHGNKDAIWMLKSSIIKDSADSIRLFYIDKEKAKRFVSESVLSNVVGTTDGLVHMLSDNGLPVNKNLLKGQIDTQQFQRWFGDSVVTKDGKPGGKAIALYHQTEDDTAKYRWCLAKKR